jgi:hypothetical protein
MEVRALALGPLTNVALPQRSISPATTRKAPVIHTVQAP